MKGIDFLGIKVSRKECVCTRIKGRIAWHTYRINNHYNYDNVIWLPSYAHKDEALLLLSLGLGKQEIEEHFNTGR